MKIDPPAGISLGELAALVGAAFWAVTTLLVRSQTARLSAVTINLGRSATASLFTLAALALLRPDALQEPPPPWAVALVIASVLVGPGIGDTLFFESVRLIGVARAMPLGGTNPLFAAILAVLLLGEQITPRLALGTGTIVLGIFLVSGRAAGITPRDARRGALLALVASLLWACSTVAVRPAVQQIDLLLANAIRLPATALVIGLYGWRTGRLNRRRDLTPRSLLVLLATGAITSVSTLLFLTAVQQAGAARAAALVSTSPLFGAPLAILLYREPLTPRLLLGTLVSVVGIVLLVGA